MRLSAGQIAWIALRSAVALRNRCSRIAMPSSMWCKIGMDSHFNNFDYALKVYRNLVSFGKRFQGSVVCSSNSYITEIGGRDAKLLTE